MAECNKCGDCCRVIPLNMPRSQLLEWHEDIKRWPRTGDGYYNTEFIFAHWTPIEPDMEKPHYTCDMFDSVNNVCTAHDKRPPVCRDYPWYGREPKDSAILYPRCSYREDMPSTRKSLPIVSIT